MQPSASCLSRVWVKSQMLVLAVMSKMGEEMWGRKKVRNSGRERTKKVGRNRGKRKARLEEGSEVGFAVSPESTQHKLAKEILFHSEKSSVSTTLPSSVGRGLGSPQGGACIKSLSSVLWLRNIRKQLDLLLVNLLLAPRKFLHLP